MSAPAPFPSGVPLALDADARVRDVRGGGRALVGGDPPRAVRLSAAGGAVLERLLRTGADGSPAARRLARTLVDGGLAHPRPARAVAAEAGVTVVIPVRDRVEMLDRCLAGVGAAGGPGGAGTVRVGVREAGVDVLVVDDGSRDPEAVAAVCARHGARVLRRASRGGPAAARNTALARVDTPLVAFLDSDCVPRSGWLDVLAGHLADPLVAAAAPRVRGAGAGGVGDEGRSGPVARYAAARSPLDLGRRPARVVPGGRVSYVPTAALLVRRAAVADGFDPALRYGEDVDLVWRLHGAGWRVRYDPAAVVDHAEPTRLRPLLARRFRYGTSAAPLSVRHPERLAPFVVHPWSAAVTGLLLARRPGLAVAVAAGQGAVLARRLRPAGAGPGAALRGPVRGAARTLTAGGRTATMLAPAVLAAGLAARPTRPAALALLLAAPLSEWAVRRPELDPVRWTALSVADDVAYGAGVWAGAARGRTWAPLRPVVRGRA